MRSKRQLKAMFPDPRMRELIDSLWREIHDNQVIEDVFQLAHGFEPGEAVKMDQQSGLWVRSMADSLGNAGTEGIVCRIIDDNRFDLRRSGFLRVNDDELSIPIPGVEYFLSPIQAGKLFAPASPEEWPFGSVREYIGTGIEGGLLVKIDRPRQDSGTIDSAAKIINQTAHGFTVGTAIKPIAYGWVKTKADNRLNAGTVGFVSEVTDANNFTMVESGTLHGVYTAGAIYFLSPTTAGAIFAQTDPEVWSAGQVREVVGVGNNTGTRLIIKISEGQVISTALFTQNIVQSGSVDGNAVLTIHQSNAPNVTIPLPTYQSSSSVLSLIAQLTSGTGLLRKTTGGWILDTTGSWNNAVQALTGANPTFDPANGLHIRISPTAPTTITFTNLIAGQSGNISVQNPGNNLYYLTLAGYTFDIAQSVKAATANTVATSNVNSKDKFSWYYDGVTVSINGQFDYK